MFKNKTRKIIESTYNSNFLAYLEIKKKQDDLMVLTT